MLCDAEMGRNPNGMGHMYMFSLFTLLYHRNQQNIVKQVYANKN